MTTANKLVSLNELENCRSPLENIRSHTTDAKCESGHPMHFGIGRLFIDVTNTDNIESIMTTSPFNSQFQPSHVVEPEGDGFSRGINHDEENYEPTRSPRKKDFIDNWQGLGTKENTIFKKLVHHASIPKFISTTEQAGPPTHSIGNLLDSLEEDYEESECTKGDDVADFETSASLAESINSLEDYSIKISSETRTNGSNCENGNNLGRVIRHIPSEESATFSVETILSCNENDKGLSPSTADSTVSEGDRLYQEALVLMQKIDALSAPSKEMSDRTILAGERLHFDAIKRAVKLEAQRKEECALREQAEMLARNDKTISVAAEDECYDRLYNRSIEMQMEGKKRRKEIAQASQKRNEIPGPEYFGYLPLSRAGDMYDKRMLAAFERERKQSELREEKNREIEAKHEFKLAEGAFAYSVNLRRFTHRQSSSQSTYDDLFSSSQSRSHSHSSDTTLKTKSLSRKEHRMRSFETDSETYVSSTSASSSACSTNAPKKNGNPKLPFSRSDNMYKRSLRVIQARRDNISHLIKEELKEYGFKLSEGSFSSKIYQN
mmetsp:Transcript_10290/g.15553  ORF Transcript_10290/g.15553 Transcript_10290/m.15553 type:complete len:551 (+) Transcript_10290:47-1699(+)|eukprot:CAMPEP_0194089238 /NCGR_PEP_ID=MMETSP0149-20130528/33354_1 /TAXON_ID=122233 /ORGANISM="Chaetoceros debilis, Strain MM31A-1" /LENGTH=550 /DNA_ID=CAMNT_0038773107 /DNA_START=29 /DNA_END=1681 /DNA_ORIENTATION=+